MNKIKKIAKQIIIIVKIQKKGNKKVKKVIKVTKNNLILTVAQVVEKRNLKLVMYLALQIKNKAIIAVAINKNYQMLVNFQNQNKVNLINYFLKMIVWMKNFKEFYMELVIRRNKK